MSLPSACTLWDLDMAHMVPKLASTVIWIEEIHCLRPGYGFLPLVGIWNVNNAPRLVKNTIHQLIDIQYVQHVNHLKFHAGLLRQKHYPTTSGATWRRRSQNSRRTLSSSPWSKTSRHLTWWLMTVSTIHSFPPLGLNTKNTANPVFQITHSIRDWANSKFRGRQLGFRSV